MDSIVSLTKGKDFLTAKGLDLFLVTVSREILGKTQKKLLSFSKKKEHLEGIVYWAGKEKKGQLAVTKVVVPRAMTTLVSFRVEALENARIIAELQKEGLMLIAQVHSHPSLQTDHDLTEEEMGFMPYEGLFSIVVPDYALAGLWPLTKTGIYFYHQGSFRRLSNEQAARYFQVTF